MKLHGQDDLNATREKLHLLQKNYESLLQEPNEMTHVCELSLQSLKCMINQLTEGIVNETLQRQSGADERD
jgi:hypothetical protein